MTLSLVAILVLLTVHRVCKRQKLNMPTLRLPLIAAIGIPLLNKLADIFNYDRLVVLQANTNNSTRLRSRHVADLETNDAFGEMALCTAEEQTASLVCKSECVLIEFERKHLLPLLEDQPQILEIMESIMAARQQQLKATKEQCAESRRLALIARMQRLFSLSKQVQ